ncbi:SDR family oxidoreductase [Pseudofrankia asymbiotica]|uniref:Short chain dehydrogenase n=1 Tax=Pseudofrankia asymbiotica TaxID=1834516 RepID=A0A1V2I0E5_9ACTN|nr:SDR family oxidoreductase [Pseudofrankia asymbiotica]ONH22897.1 short chain dehydrogenase [Pseudofrankia asymbiotica]
MTGLVEGKAALVTGAANGIGRASALAFAREGARVAVADVDADGGEETVRLIAKQGGEAFFVPCDVADEDAVAAAVALTVQRYGALDCAHNNAGLGQRQVPLAEISRASWDRTLAVNLTGTWLCLKHEIQHMQAHGGGAIVATSSATSLLGVPLTAAYAATKAAINQLVRSAAMEYAKVGIRVNAVLPGPIGTEMVTRAMAENPALEDHLMQTVPLARVGTPEEVADAVVFLCSPRSGFTTGSLLTIDGGQVLH